MKLTRKILAARECLSRRLENELATTCVVKLDRMQIVLQQNPSPALRDLPAFRRFPSHWIRRKPGQKFLPYKRAQWFWSERSSMKFAIECEPLEPWLAPYRLTLIADDWTGLRPVEIFSILELIPDFKLTTLEIAFDFQEKP